MLRGTLEPACERIARGAAMRGRGADLLRRRSIVLMSTSISSSSLPGGPALPVPICTRASAHAEHVHFNAPGRARGRERGASVWMLYEGSVRHTDTGDCRGRRSAQGAAPAGAWAAALEAALEAEQETAPGRSARLAPRAPAAACAHRWWQVQRAALRHYAGEERPSKETRAFVCTRTHARTGHMHGAQLRVFAGPASRRGQVRAAGALALCSLSKTWLEKSFLLDLPPIVPAWAPGLPSRGARPSLQHSYSLTSFQQLVSSSKWTSGFSTRTEGKLGAALIGGQRHQNGAVRRRRRLGAYAVHARRHATRRRGVEPRQHDVREGSRGDARFSS